MIPEDRRYTKEHEWAKIEDDGLARVGISKFAQEQLGDIVFLNLPPVGTSLSQLEKMGEIESVKAVSDLYSPLSGIVVEVNEAIINQPERVNHDPYESGWLFLLQLTRPEELGNLLSATQYQDLLDSQG